MGYGIKLLITQRPHLPKALRGEKDEWGFTEQLIIEADMVHKLQDDLCRLSFWTTDFIGSCKTLFTIYEDDEGDFWDNIYIWKYKYIQMEWKELKAVIEPLVVAFLDAVKYKNWVEEEKREIIDALEKLISVSDITRKFQIR